jgi:hypothetical protein
MFLSLIGSQALDSPHFLVRAFDRGIIPDHQKLIARRLRQWQRELTQRVCLQVGLRARGPRR